MMDTFASTANGLLRRVPPWTVYLLGTLPALYIAWLTVTGEIGVDPVKGIEHRLGYDALYFLIGGLAVTPLRRLTGVTLLRFRRQIGLVAFAYVVLHMTAWFALDMGLLWRQALGDLYKRPYLLFGILAFILLIPPAATSNNASVRRMGRKWHRLHWLVYPAVILGVVHYLWSFKIVPPIGWFWLSMLLLLLTMRLVWRRGRSKLRAA